MNKSPKQTAIEEVLAKAEDLRSEITKLERFSEHVLVEINSHTESGVTVFVGYAAHRANIDLPIEQMQQIWSVVNTYRSKLLQQHIDLMRQLEYKKAKEQCNE